MKLSQAKVALKHIIAANMLQDDPMQRLVPHLVSAAGLGKSSIVRQVTEELTIGLIDLRLSQMDPVDLRGIPGERDGKTCYFPPAELPFHGAGVLLLDEFAQGSPSVMNASSQLVLDNKIGTYNLPRQWHPVAASNRRSDRANAHEIPSHLKNRLIYLPCEADADETAAWGMLNGMHPFVIGFLRYRKELVHKPNYDHNAFPSPRSWMFVSVILKMEITDRVIEHQMIAGAVGDGAAAEFIGYLQLFRELPEARDVFNNPMKVRLPEGDKKPAIIYALCGLLAREVDASTMPALVTFLGRISQDFAVATMKDIRARDERLIRCPAYIGWVHAHHQIIL